MSHQVDAVVNQKITEVIGACRTAVHDNLEAVQQIDTLLGLAEELQGIWHTVEDLKGVFPHDVDEMALCEGEVCIV
ncbi:hypothetical protein HG530_008473 [Fusarium avenaceum]|nr:hypothetical protein HG530_008473 [Fusarium avenaceum]